MSVLQKLEEEIKNAMRSRDQGRLDTVRMIKTTVKNKEIELIRPLTEEEFIQVLSTMAKKHRESIDQFKSAGRQELVEKEQSELSIVESFLPKALTDAEVEGLIQEAVLAVKASGPKDMGAVMKHLKDKTTGRVDGKKLSELVRSKLASLS